jgi:tRNA dimethylallyltransferase
MNLQSANDPLGVVDGNGAGRGGIDVRQKPVQMGAPLGIGRPLSDWQAKETRPADWDFTWTGLDMAPEDHRAALRARCARMAAGILEECAALRERGVPADAPAFQSLGYREGWACLAGRTDRPAFEAAFYRQTLLYVKRQRTWFRAEPVRWWTASLPIDAAAIADEMLRSKK